MKRFHQYISDVLSGKEIVGDFIRLAVDRHIKDVEDENYWLDEKTAQEVIDFAEICRHWKGEKAGQRIVLENWQVFYFGSLMGWKRVDGRRRFTRSYMQLSRKNAKTTMLAILSIYHLLMDGEHGAQVYCGATKEEQARILVNDMGQIINKTPEIRKEFKLFKHKEHYNRVVHLESSSYATALGGDSKTSDGFDPSMGNIDEFHEHKTDGILDVIESGMGSRLQPMLNIITTAGFNKNLPCYSVTRRTGIEILKGIKSDENYFIMIYELDEGDDWNDKTNWIKSNPNYDVSVRPDYLDSRYNKAKNEGGSTEVKFLTKNLNVWTDSESTWISDEIWQSCNFPFDKSQLDGARCFGGLDLASSNDLNAFCLVFPDFEPMPVLWWFWMPDDKVQSTNEDHFRNWIRDGYIVSTEGRIVDHSFIIKTIIDLAIKYNIVSIAFDRFLATHGVVQELVREGVDMTELGQGFVSLSTPTKELEKLVLSQEINNFGNPVMRWMMANVVLDIDAAGNIKINKGKSADKVDGPAAFVDAIAEMMTTEDNSVSEIRYV